MAARSPSPARKKKAELCRTVLERLLGIVERGDTHRPLDAIRYAVELASEGNADRIDEIMQGAIAITYRGRQVKCKTLGQKHYVDAIKTHTATFAIGPAGTGKTYLAIAMAVLALKNKDVERIALARPAVEAGEKLGFLPGDLQQKVDPYLRPLYDALNEMRAWKATMPAGAGAVGGRAAGYMRGRTLSDAFIILDEGRTPLRADKIPDRNGHGQPHVIPGTIHADRPAAGKKSVLARP
jgi:phosphate starvation-inducible PhoH-like protein